MAKKLPTFLITQNKFAKNDSVFIIHSKSPFLICEVVPNDSHFEPQEITYQHNSLTIVVRELFSENISSEKLNNILKRMLQWYIHLPS